jgi:hypothetical protein
VHASPSPVPVGPRPRGRSWPLAAVALVGLAQAAAVLVALGLAWQTPDRPDGRPGGGPSIAGHREPAPVRSETPVTADVDIPEGQILVITADRIRARIRDATPREEMNTASDPGLYILDFMESATTPQVAAR